MVISSTLEASVFMGKNYSDNLHSIKITGANLTLKQMFEISEQLIVEQSEEIFGVTQMNWESSPWNSYLWSMMKRYESEPNIKYCLGTTVGMVQRFITIQNFGHNRRRIDGIRVDYFPRLHYIAARPRSPKVHEQKGRTRTIPRTNHLHVDVQ